MIDITTKATTISRESSVAPSVEQRWISVVFVQGEEAYALLHMIDRNGPEEAIHHLSQWDYGNETRDAALVNRYVYDDIPQSPTDRVVRDNVSAYALTFNHHFGYVSLLRHFDWVAEDAPESVAPPARFDFDRQRSTRRTNRLRL